MSACLHRRCLPARLQGSSAGRPQGKRHRLPGTCAGLVCRPWRPWSSGSSLITATVIAASCSGRPAPTMVYLRTRPYTPRTNGKAERFIQTSLREWAYVWPYASSQQRSAALIVWLDQYNIARPHTALGGCPPAARLRQLQLLCSSEGTVASSRPAFTTDRSGGPGQGSRKATGNRRRAASLAACRCGYTLPRRDPCLTSSTTFVAMTARDLSSTRRITWLCSNARWTL